MDKFRLFKSSSLIVLSAALLSACQTTPAQKELLNKNKSLEKQLSVSQTKVLELERKEAKLNQDVKRLEGIVGVLGEEKSSRVEESSQLRNQVRKFAQNQIDTYKQFLLRGDLLDFIGGELVARQHVDEQPLLLVDMANVIHRPGSITGVGGYFVKPGPYTVKVLRPVGKQLVAIWQSETLVAEQTGFQQKAFPLSVGVQQGDVLAYFFPQGVGVGYDKGTGDTRFMKKDLNVGGSISNGAPSGEKEKRAYSIGVYGLLN
ncbi:MAG: hypothetical protein K6L73_05160 [Cellvibrionaceae bacterium]